jgi:hypothetical protein
LIFLNVGYDNLDGKEFVQEQKLKNIEFYRNVYNQYKKNKTIFIIALVEFGCEWLIPHYLLPKIAKRNKDKNIVVVGWYGREFLYKHLVDEFWELSENCMGLRETVRALHHHSKTIKKLELYLKNFGEVLPSHFLGNMLMESRCLECGKAFGSRDSRQVCPVCLKDNIRRSFFSAPEKNKRHFLPLPKPSIASLEWAEKNKLPRMVGIFARSRKSYGRNLSQDFYVQLIHDLKEKGFNPVWMGEKQSVHKCPVDDILDLTLMPESRNLENVIAFLKHFEFTIQFWTASTRLSMAANCPYLLVESPDQLYGAGQEGLRLRLLNVANTKQKIVLCNYKKVCENIAEFNSIIHEATNELLRSDTSIKIGLVDDADYVQNIIDRQNNEWS